jgi:hypothetical protein
MSPPSEHPSPTTMSARYSGGAGRMSQAAPMRMMTVVSGLKK